MNRHLFVYGTLRDGLDHPEAIWLSQHSQLIGVATTIGTLYRIGWYPGLVESDDGAVVGELLLLDDPIAILERLDDYEGVAAGEYERKEAEVFIETNRVLAWVYYFRGDVSELRWITSGDFLKDLNTHFD